MSISYLTEARNALFSVLEALEGLSPGAKAAVRRDVRLRPPKARHLGDLSTNAAILLKSMDNIDFDRATKSLVSGFEALPGIKEVRLEPNGYINIRYSPDFWGRQVPRILMEGVRYGLEDLAVDCAEIPAPAAVIDLYSYRDQANLEALERLAALAGGRVEPISSAPREAAGFPLAAAIGKCTEEKTRFALLANPPGFIDAFSPILAIDRSYGNPVFAIPYARMILQRLGVGENQAKAGANNGVDMSVLKLPVEMELARALCGWPPAVAACLRKGDSFYLASFLETLSLLFFRLFEGVHPVSSAYLTETAEGPARFALLGALDKILDGGTTVLGVERVKEYG